MSAVSPHPFSLRDRVALVTGAGRGLGLAIARGLAAAGAHVVLNGRNEAALAGARDAIAAAGGVASLAPFDVGDTDAATAAVAAIGARHGRLDVFVSNVGVRNRKTLFDFTLDEVRALLDTDLVAPFAMAREAARLMIPRRHGRIINVTSIIGDLARPGDAAYIAAKGGLSALTRALAAELAPHGITANGIAPGYFATETNAAMVVDAQVTAAVERRVMLKRWAQPDEIAGAAVFLASDAASYVTGHVLAVDGGLSANF